MMKFTYLLTKDLPPRSKHVVGDILVSVALWYVLLFLLCLAVAIGSK